MIEAASLLPSNAGRTGRRPSRLCNAATTGWMSRERHDGFPTTTFLNERLLRAESAARAGQVAVARRLCAAVILDQMPLLAGSESLLEQTIAILLRCRAFGQISRLLAATLGNRVQFQISQTAECTMPPVGERGCGGGVIYHLNANQMTEKLADSIVHQWSAALVSPDYPHMSQTSRPSTGRVRV